MFKRENVLRRTTERKRERERERVVVVVKVVVECALVLKKKKEDECDEINCRLVFFLHSVLLLGNCKSKKKSKNRLFGPTKI